VRPKCTNSSKKEQKRPGMAIIRSDYRFISKKSGEYRTFFHF